MRSCLGAVRIKPSTKLGEDAPVDEAAGADLGGSPAAVGPSRGSRGLGIQSGIHPSSSSRDCVIVSGARGQLRSLLNRWKVRGGRHRTSELGRRSIAIAETGQFSAASRNYAFAWALPARVRPAARLPEQAAKIKSGGRRQLGRNWRGGFGAAKLFRQSLPLQAAP
jgi:hypothetical protein